MFLDHAGARRIGEYHLQFFCGHVIDLLALHPHQAEDQRAAIVEQPDQWRGNARQQFHRLGHDQCDAFGRTQGDLLRYQFTDHQRGISGQADHQHETECDRQFLAHAQRMQSLRHRSAEAGAGISAGDNADQRDPDLHRGEKLARARLLPLSAMPCSCALRAETIASSDMANTPLISTSTIMIATSNHGKGVMLSIARAKGHRPFSSKFHIISSLLSVAIHLSCDKRNLLDGGELSCSKKKT